MSLSRLCTSAAALVLSFATLSDAAPREIADCTAIPIEGQAILTRDVDCSAVPHTSMAIASGVLNLNGYTVTSGTTFGIACSGNCKIVGPGTLTGEGGGINGSRALRVENVEISLTGFGAVGVAAIGALTLDRVTITGPTFGAISHKSARITDSTITATVGGVVSGSGSLTEGPCSKGAVLLRRSSITGTTSTPCDGTDAHCADVISCKRPKLVQSTCNTSCQAGVDSPCPTWGVCAAD